MAAFADMVIAEVGFRVARIGGVDVREAAAPGFATRSSNGGTDAAGRSIRLGVRVAPAGSLARLQAWASDGQTGSILWSGQRMVDPYGAERGQAAGFGRVVNDLTTAIYQVIGTPPPNASPADCVAVAAYSAIAGSNLRNREDGAARRRAAAWRGGGPASRSDPPPGGRW